MSRMKEAGIKNISAIILDLSDVKELVRLLRINSNNINQIAKKANQTGSIYQDDIKILQKQQDEIWNSMKKILLELSKIS